MTSDRSKPQETQRSVPGWVYVITNDSMPELVKIGFTTRHPKERAKELEGTNVPGSFVIEFAALVEQPRDLEYDVHKHLSGFGLRVDKEWFRCEVGIAIWSIREMYDGELAEWYSDDADLARIRAETKVALYRKRLADRDKYDHKLSRDNQQQEIAECLDKLRSELIQNSAPVILNNPRVFDRPGKLNAISLHIKVFVGLCVFWSLFVILGFRLNGETIGDWEEWMPLIAAFAVGYYVLLALSGAISYWNRQSVSKIERQQQELLLPVRRLFPDIEKESAYYQKNVDLGEQPSILTPVPAGLRNAIGGKARVIGDQFSGTIRNSTQDWVITLVFLRIPLSYEPCSFRMPICVLPGEEHEFQTSVDSTATDHERDEQFSWSIHETYGYSVEDLPFLDRG